ncbi:hypothetical protein D3C77_600290 [compost metagenome]
MVLAGVVIPTRRINKHAAVGLAVAVAVGQQLEQRLAFDLCDRIPHRHVDGADRHRALAMAARLLVREHGVPDLVRVQVLARRVHQRLGIRLHHARNEAFAHQLALAVSAI